MLKKIAQQKLQETERKEEQDRKSLEQQQKGQSKGSSSQQLSQGNQDQDEDDIQEEEKGSHIEAQDDNPQQYLKNHGDKWAADLGIVSHRNYDPQKNQSTTVIDVFPVFRPLIISNSYNYKQGYDWYDNEGENSRIQILKLEEILNEMASEK